MSLWIEVGDGMGDYGLWGRGVDGWKITKNDVKTLATPFFKNASWLINSNEYYFNPLKKLFFDCLN